MAEDASKAHKRRGWGVYALAALFWLPLLSGVVSRIAGGKTWFGDYGAIACAAEKMLAGEPFYSHTLACPGVHLSGYVYHPAVAQAFTWPLSVLGQPNMLIAYAALFVAAAAYLIWFMIGRAGAERGKRNWFAAFIVGSAVYWGNIAVISHAAIGLCATALRRWPSLLVIAIALSSLAKPLFVVFGVVFALMRWPLWRRALYVLATLALSVGPTLWFMAHGGALAEQWRELVSYYVYIDRPGYAFLGWVDALGGDVASPGAAIGYVAFALVMGLSALVIAEGMELSDDARALLGLSLGVILIPRLMGQDFWLLGPGLLTFAAALGAANAQRQRLLERALLAICIVVLIANLADLSDILLPIAMFALALAIVIGAVFVAIERRVGPALVWRRVWSGAA